MNRKNEEVNLLIVINYSHPLTAEQLQQLEKIILLVQPI